MVLWLGRLLDMKSKACGAAAAATIYGMVTRAQTGAAVAADAMASSGADVRMAAAFSALAIGSGYLARAVKQRTVTKIVRERRESNDVEPTKDMPSDKSSEGAGFAPEAEPLKAAGEVHDPEDTIVIHRMRLWSSADTVLRVKRAAIACGRGETTFQSFMLSPSESHGGQVPQYLFPVHGACRSEDLPYLKTMMYGDFFRKEAPPQPDEELIAIEGFGPYRPAQFSDTYHPKFPTNLPATTAPSPVPGTPFFTQHGTVWAQFTHPPKPSLAERRAIERDAKLYGAPRVPAHLLPAPAAPVALMLDGSTFQQQRPALPSGEGAADTERAAKPPDLGGEGKGAAPSP